MVSLQTARRRSNCIAMGVFTAAALFGILWLVLILAVLVWRGLAGLSLEALGQIAPGIGGSMLMVFFAVLIGAPLGVLAGTYMAEYGRYGRLARVARFINDILLSVPSIVVGLFIYEVLVAPLGGFSGWAGAAALAVIVIPVVVRTTEGMLMQVPGELREAAAALGLPRSVVIRHVAYRAALSGIVTGILLAVARIGGETAPLLFTAMSSDSLSFAMTQPLASLPVAIYNFARAPDEPMHQLAWTGALLMTFAVLALSVLARGLSTRGAR